MVARIGILLVLLTVLATGLWLKPRWHFVEAFPDLIPAYYAKEFCSCYFVVGNDEAYCHAYVEQWLPISDFQLNPAQRWVQASGLGRTQRASYFGPRQGCGLEPYGR
ncbi:amidase [Aestuariirhabdus litorea]|uniref:Amidase n=1 Tax=Aestuariirhabdus litorea TaxID=2528527 RepID=A0A3P3VNF9_9GAMM|nr:amidase [Aestuariirhabdus litorea]RRJ83877.1 amidase [Aestuariirhabdus litorea]RWW97099.1 amidase [Endozoicomonadaceae bacterium GTF-13]